MLWLLWLLILYFAVITSISIRILIEYYELKLQQKLLILNFLIYISNNICMNIFFFITFFLWKIFHCICIFTCNKVVWKSSLKYIEDKITEIQILKIL